MRIIILNGEGDVDDEMAFYADGELKAVAEINGNIKQARTVMEFMVEFDLNTIDVGITDVADLERKPDVVTNMGRLEFESDEVYGIFLAENPDHADDPESDMYYPFPQILTDEELAKYR